MTYPVVIIPELDGQVTAILEGQDLGVTAPTREQALARLHHRARRLFAGEVERTTLELPPTPNLGVTGLAGTFAEDPDLPDIVAAAYRARDAAPDDGF
jgi:hypothetical protein